MEIFLYFVIGALLLIILVLLFRTNNNRIVAPDISGLEDKLRFALASATSVKEIKETLDKLPHDLLTSITHSLGQRTGKLNELLATFELTQYDRLFYLGEPVDFIGVKYGKGVDFIEVKTGRASLTPAELELKDLVECKMVNYVHLSVNKIGIAEEVDRGEE
ncbi:Holliday junction resolvase-like protein [Chloroflexota bacterium]